MHFRQQVLDGTKTQTRRLKKEGDYAVYDEDGTVLAVYDKNDRLRWCVGYTYAIQPPGRGARGVGRFRLATIREEKVQDIQPMDCGAEGLSLESPDGEGHRTGCGMILAFGELWDSIHKKAGRRWEDDPKAWVLEMEVV